MTVQPDEGLDANELNDALVAAGMKKYAKSFQDAGYWTFEDLGADPDEVRAAIIEVLPPKMGGIVNQILSLWKKKKKAQDEANKKPDPVPPALVDSPLAQALESAQLKEYALAFQLAGYPTLEELGEKAEDVRTSVAAVIPDKAGVVSRICALWETDKKARDAGDAKPAPLSRAKLPAGSTFDLTQPTLKIDDVTYKIPTELSVTASAETFAPADWMTLAKRTKALYGIQLDRAIASAEDEGGRAARAALVWKVPDSDDYLDANPRGRVESSMYYTSSLSNLVHNRIVNASLSFECPFVTASASVNRDEKQASSETHKRLYMTGMYNYTQAQLTLSECTAASPAFVSAIDAALAHPEAERYRALEQVFEMFGQVVPRTVTLGGQLFFTSERETSGRLDEEQVKTTVAAAVEAKYQGIGGGASASFQDGSGTKIGAQEIAESVSFTCVGGDTTLASNPKDWASTVKNPNSWAIIERKGLRPSSTASTQIARSGCARSGVPGFAGSGMTRSHRRSTSSRSSTAGPSPSPDHRRREAMRSPREAGWWSCWTI